MCVLRVSGASFDPDAFLAGSRLEAEAVFRKGEHYRPLRPESGIRDQSGINVAVSEAEWDALGPQVEDAERFLRRHWDELKALHALVGDGGLRLDFPLDQRVGLTSAAQCDHFPVSLVRLAGELGIALELSIYAGADDDDDGENGKAEGPTGQQ